ncbi:MAG: ATP synthase F0 subunit B [Flavobacteriales bacterium TMED191]|nr:MAG: ATP synthase F0 subunit B [Flavobacteriales bacterium TMED191]
MELVTPGVGLLFWMLFAFSIVLVLLKKFAWKPILSALKEREDRIEDSLIKAEETRQKTESANSDIEKMINQANEERNSLLRQAKEEIAEYKKDQKTQIKSQIDLQLDSAKEEIAQQKRMAMEDLKAVVAELSIEIAEKILKQELDNEQKYNELIKENVKKLDI